MASRERAGMTGLGLLLVTGGAITAIWAYLGGRATYGHTEITSSDVFGVLGLCLLTVVPAALLWIPAVRARSTPLRFDVSGWVPFAIASCALLTSLFGLELAAAYSAYGPAVFFAGLAELVSAVVAVRQTAAPWRAGLSLTAAPVIAFAGFTGTIVASGSYLPPTRWEVPFDYRGYVTTAYGISTCQPLPRDFLVSVVIVDRNRHACTSNALPNGYTELWTEYVFAGDGAREPIPQLHAPHPLPSEVIAVPSVWGFVDSLNGKCPRAREFFVGTTTDERLAPKFFDRRAGLGCDLKPVVP